MLFNPLFWGFLPLKPLPKTASYVTVAVNVCSVSMAKNTIKPDKTSPFELCASGLATSIASSELTQVINKLGEGIKADVSLDKECRL